MKSRLTSNGKRTKSCGAVAVEASISLITFLIILILSVDLSQYLFKSIGLRYVLGTTVRWASLGKKITDPSIDNPGVTLTREQSIITMLQNNAKTFGVNVSNAAITLCPLSNPTCGTFNAGGPNDIVVLKVDLPFKFLIWHRTSTISASATFKNEPYA